MKLGLIVSICLVLLTGIVAFRKTNAPDAITGAWRIETAGSDQVLLFMDGYVTHTVYDRTSKRFDRTRGGTYTFNEDKLYVRYEFDSRDKDSVGQSSAYPATITNGKLVTTVGNNNQTWTRLDDGNAPLAGLWAISARKQNGELQPIHQTGTRKTVKILTGTRFQWAAIDPGTKQFMGTGGGTYTFQDGKYTEHIEYFSRDSSRVGNSLSFDGKLENGDWHHSGLSSKGDPIYEVWSRKK